MFDESKFNTWKFIRTDCDGTTRETTFNSESWFPAIEEFVLFLKGNGFSVDSDSIGINATKHKHVPDEWTGGVYYPEDGEEQVRAFNTDVFNFKFGGSD